VTSAVFTPVSLLELRGIAADTVTATDVLARRAVQIANKLRCLAHLEPDGCSTSRDERRVYVPLGRGWLAEGVEFAASIPNLFNVPIRYGEFLDMSLRS